MAHDVQNPYAQLRAYLHGRLADFVSTYEGKALRDGDTVLGAEVRRVNQRKLDALLDGEEVAGIPRFDLPDWHPESTVYGGSPTDRFVLGRDDILRFMPPY